MSTATQLAFTLRTSPNCKTVHLVGNWDGYKGQLPLSVDPSKNKPGAWKGTFRFQGTTLKPGQRYWYYYIMDGYHVSHDPAQPFTTEPTTGRQLNILDVPTSKSSSSSSNSSSTSSRGSSSSHSSHSTRHSGSSSSSNSSSSSGSSRSSNNSRHSSSSSSSSSSSTSSSKSNTSSSHGHGHSSRTSTEPAKGRPISPSRIAHPRPVNPVAARNLQTAQYAKQIATLSRKLAHTRIESPVSSSVSSEFEEDIDDSSDSDSDSGSDISDDSVPSLGSSRTSDCSSPRSIGSGRSSAGSSCSCDRWGITRKGDRVRLDCGGSRCGNSDVESCESSGESEGEQYKMRIRQEARRNGVMVRGERERARRG